MSPTWLHIYCLLGANASRIHFPSLAQYLQRIMVQAILALYLDYPQWYNIYKGILSAMSYIKPLQRILNKVKSNVKLVQTYGTHTYYSATNTC